MKKYFFVIVLIMRFFILKAQPDTTRIYNPELKKKFITTQIVPLSFIGVGSLLNIGSIKENIHKVTPRTQVQVDNYLQYCPIVEMYATDALGFDHKNSEGTQTKYLLISEVLSSVFVQSLKGATHVERPRGGNTSFPSGHTTNAFVGATILYKEFKDTSPLIAYSGFAVATTTGILRMTNNAHWLPDVITGAGIGILTVNLVYHFVPAQRSARMNKICLIPKLYPGKYGLYIQYRF